MACACKGRKKSQYVWVDGNGQNPVTYNTEIEAKAKILRKGGSYTTVPVNAQAG